MTEHPESPPQYKITSTGSGCSNFGGHCWHPGHAFINQCCWCGAKQVQEYANKMQHGEKLGS